MGERAPAPAALPPTLQLAAALSEHGRGRPVKGRAMRDDVRPHLLCMGSIAQVVQVTVVERGERLRTAAALATRHTHACLSPRLAGVPCTCMLMLCAFYSFAT